MLLHQHLLFSTYCDSNIPETSVDQGVICSMNYLVMARLTVRRRSRVEVHYESATVRSSAHNHDVEWRASPTGPRQWLGPPW